MSATEPTSPPPLLRAAALLKRASEHAAKLEADLESAAHQLQKEQASTEKHEAERYRQVADLLSALRVRQLDARTCADRLPTLAQETEALAENRKASPPAQEGSAP